MSKIPEGYIVASTAHYKDGKSPFTGKDMGYEFSVQLLNVDNGDMPRGTGQTEHEAYEQAVQRARPNLSSEERIAEDVEAMQEWLKK